MNNNNNNNNLITPLQNMLQSQALLLFLKNQTTHTKTPSKNNSSDNTSLNSYMYMMLLTTILASLLPVFISKIGSILSIYLSNYMTHLKRKFVNKNTSIIRLSYSNIISKYGNSKCEISDEMIGIMNYLRHNMYKIKELYSIRQDECFQRYNDYNDRMDYLPIYKIDQDEKIKLWCNPKDNSKCIYLTSKKNNIKK